MILTLTILKYEPCDSLRGMGFAGWRYQVKFLQPRSYMAFSDQAKQERATGDGGI